MVSNTMLNTLTGNLLPHAAANRRTPNTLVDAAGAVWRLLSYAFGLAAFWSVLCFFLLFPCFLIMGYLLWVAVIYAVTHCSLSLTFLPSNDRAVRPCLSVVLRVYYVGYIAMCYGSYTGHVFSFNIRRCLCYLSRVFPVPVYLFVVMLDGGSGSRMPLVFVWLSFVPCHSYRRPVGFRYSTV